MSEVNYPGWVPQEYIEAETFWEKAKSLKEFENISCEFIVGGHLTTTIEDAMLKDYPIADHNWRRVEVFFGEYDVGQKQLQVTYDIDKGEVESKSLHEAGYEDMNWLCDPDDIRIAGVDDDDTLKDSREDMPWGQTDD